MQRQIIKLSSDAAHFKPIFFKDGQGNVFRNRLTKGPVRLFFGCLLFTIATYFLALKSPSTSWLFFLGILLTSTAIIVSTFRLNKFYKWKSEVKNYLNTVSQTTEAALTLNQDSFELQLDDRIIIQKLDSIKKIEINPEYVFISAADENFVIPSISMSPTEFAAVSEYLRGKGTK
ncbi:MAG TPA: hypothetical protein VI385_15320 [Flavisolibacter sp.]